MDKSVVIKIILEQRPDALAIYAFGSRVHGTHTSSSDLDLALLVPKYTCALERFDLSNLLANTLGYEVDLLDFRESSTVMQNQILTKGERLWCSSSRVNIYEAAILSQLTNLNTARDKLLKDITETGSIYE